MLIKDKIAELIYQKEKMIARSHKLATNAGYRQMLNRLSVFNFEINKLEKELKNSQK